jgi:hypothetical protein
MRHIRAVAMRRLKSEGFHPTGIIITVKPGCVPGHAKQTSHNTSSYADSDSSRQHPNKTAEHEIRIRILGLISPFMASSTDVVKILPVSKKGKPPALPGAHKV